MIIGFFDGACEPTNPNGSMGIGALLYDAPNAEPHNGTLKLGATTLLFQYSKCIHRGEDGFINTSNNVAEYVACRELLNFIIQNNLSNRNVVLYGDSKLVVNQMNGEWNMNGGIYIPYAKECQDLIRNIKSVRFLWLPREKNEEADRLSKIKMIERNVKFKIQPNK